MKINFAEAKETPEYASSMIRFGFSVVSSVFLGLAMKYGYYEESWFEYILFAVIFFLYTTVVFVSILYFPRVPMRPYLTIPFDIAGISVAMLFTYDKQFSPFFLFYAWYFVSYSLRYGRGQLFVAAIFSLIGFVVVLLTDDGWYSHVFDIVMYVVFLVVMPLYLDAMLRKINRARDETNKANQAKSEFLAAMSHEIRTPMSGIVGVTSLLEQTELDKNQREYIVALQESSIALNALIDDILDLSKIEAGKYTLVEERFNLPKTMLGVAQMFTASANAKGLELFLNYSPDLPDYLFGDSKRLRQIVLNLVSNAVKFTSEGEVVIKVRRSEHQLIDGYVTVRIEVVDTGPGLNVEERQRIFEPFYQATAKSRQSKEISGTGLGTTISSNLVRLMHGEIGVDAGKDAGCCFWFDIPMRSDEGQYDYLEIPEKNPLVIYESQPTSRKILESYCEGINWPFALTSEQTTLVSLIEKYSKQGLQPIVLLSELSCGDQCSQLGKQLKNMFTEIKLCKLLHLSSLHNLDDEQRELFSEFLPLPITPHRLRRVLLRSVGVGGNAEAAKQDFGMSTIHRFLHVLVAEDSPINAKVIMTFLEQDGHRVTHVEDGKLACEALGANQFDLVLMDMRMPNMDGIEATKAWRALETDDRHVPIIALTANATPEDKNNCLASGMDDFLSKPVNREKLREILKRIS